MCTRAFWTFEQRRASRVRELMMVHGTEPQHTPAFAHMINTHTHNIHTYMSTHTHTRVRYTLAARARTDRLG